MYHNYKYDLLYKLRSHYQERLWLKKHGKRKFIQFDDDELLELRKYFTALDADGGGNKYILLISINNDYKA